METLHAGINELARNASAMEEPHLLVVDERCGRARVCGVGNWVPAELSVPPELCKRIDSDVRGEFPRQVFVVTIGPTTFSVYKTAGAPPSIPDSDTASILTGQDGESIDASRGDGGNDPPGASRGDGGNDPPGASRIC
jgi:hypothetical protein